MIFPQMRYTILQRVKQFVIVKMINKTCPCTILSPSSFDFSDSPLPLQGSFFFPHLLKKKGGGRGWGSELRSSKYNLTLFVIKYESYNEIFKISHVTKYLQWFKAKSMKG